MLFCLNTPSRRENTVLRANLDPRTVYVIPNAVIAEQFKPRTSPLPTDASKQNDLSYIGAVSH